ncbi:MULTISPECIES: NAD(P)-dependent oxidoreductase [unclassified Saccharopolyspora]|uniref:NAD-dependent epimerase/dehydratase family protein n=1 Tax=unclassified Saccharopolyspora TaxID=2646250 RepID=UPI001CD66918|nr:MULTISPECIES: NAD-dependent epimerase/dehydratase family protein [unclassified Saccharopolyspora]MCA1226228.1 NAD-dependent epimerase/dehydratase family protein [Saccharopolyspora sp. 6M]MCA1278194.1 NAD-dependent epimerase/dehydratase family protein [Saccharopolyspora sp. 7B]
MRVLVTGGAGFIGSHVADRLRADGHEVLLVDALLPQAHRTRAIPEHLGGHGLTVADLRDPDIADHVVRGVDVVCHHAAVVGLETGVADMPDYVAHNELATAHLLAAMAEHRVRRLVLAGSMVVYGEGRYRCARHDVVQPGPRRQEDLDAGMFEPRCPRCDEPLVRGTVPEDAPLDPRSTYAATKLAQENLAALWARDTGASAIALRYHNVYGPRMPRNTPYAGVASLFRSSLARGEAPVVFEDGAQTRDFVHVGDVAAANALAAAQERTGFRAYNVCSGDPRTIGEMADARAAADGGPEPRISGRYRLGDVRHVVADPSRAASELGFTAEVPFGTGMKEFATAPLRA